MSGLNGKSIRVDRWRMGEPISASKLDQPGDAVRAMIGGVNPPRQVNPGKVTRGSKYFLLQSVSDDYLVGHEITWTDGGPEFTEDDTDVYIAKPFHLQKQWYHGKTIASRTYSYTGTQARTVTYDGEDEDQIIIPIYQIANGDYEGDLIFAEYVPGGTGVKVGDEIVYWQERSDGRGYVSEDTA